MKRDSRPSQPALPKCQNTPLASCDHHNSPLSSSNPFSESGYSGKYEILNPFLSVLYSLIPFAFGTCGRPHIELPLTCSALECGSSAHCMSATLSCSCDRIYGTCMFVASSLVLRFGLFVLAVLPCFVLHSFCRRRFSCR